jgi:hypothetical protein
MFGGIYISLSVFRTDLYGFKYIKSYTAHFNKSNLCQKVYLVSTFSLARFFVIVLIPYDFGQVKAPPKTNIERLSECANNYFL